jgi:hypothetical protein
MKKECTKMSNKLTNRTSENLPNVLSSKNITQNGKTNAVIQHAETVNINVHPSINPPTGLNTMFGDLKISDNDAKLLAEFKNDYKNILKYCIRIDPTGEAFDIHCLELIDLNYTRWQFDWRDFESEKIREIVYHTLKNFNEYLDYLSDQYMIPLLANPNFVIYKNQSREDGERLREVIIPNTIRIRKELRDRYLELWPVKEPIVR